MPIRKPLMTFVRGVSFKLQGKKPNSKAFKKGPRNKLNRIKMLILFCLVIALLGIYLRKKLNKRTIVNK